jgi:chorismate synthase
MAGSTFGTHFRLSSFGESHGVAIGGVIDGVPAGFEISIEQIQTDLNSRRPGQSSIVTQRNEEDELLILSGIHDGKTTGAPIGFMVRNKDQQPRDYAQLESAFRPSHADKTYFEKYGHRDHRGGGRSSARETIARVVAGSIAKQFLNSLGIRFSTYVDQVGDIKLIDDAFFMHEAIESNPVRCPDQMVAQEMEELIRSVRKEGDTIGGAIRCIILHVPAGIGEPVFDKLHAELGKAMLSINAVKGIEFGSGFDSIKMRGSQHNDLFNSDGTTITNHSGGIQGGISNGMPITFRVAFKPVSTIMMDQSSIDEDGKEVTLSGKGRHDPCVVPRAVPIVEAMAALVLFDLYLRSKVSRWKV